MGNDEHSTSICEPYVNRSALQFLIRFLLRLAFVVMVGIPLIAAGRKRSIDNSDISSCDKFVASAATLRFA